MKIRLAKERRWLAAIGLAAVVCGACHKTESADEKDKTTTPPVKVVTETVAVRTVARVIPLTGNLTAELRTDLTANSTGRVAKTFVECGQKVSQGEILAQLDVHSAKASALEARASVASAKTQLEAAQAECDRYDALVARGAITQQEHDKQTAACKGQLAALAVSQARATSAALVVGDGKIRAPFAGVVTERFISVGDYVQPSSKVVTLVVSNPLRLKLTVPERRIGEVKEGALVTFSPSALPNKTFSGHVKYLSGEVRQATRDVVVEAIVPNEEGALLPGMFVNVSLQVGEHPMPVVPKSAVFTAGEEHRFYIVKDRRLVLRVVRLGMAAGDSVAVEEGAAPGEPVVINPSPSMFDGAQVE